MSSWVTGDPEPQDPRPPDERSTKIAKGITCCLMVLVGLIALWAVIVFLLWVTLKVL